MTSNNIGESVLYTNPHDNKKKWGTLVTVGDIFCGIKFPRNEYPIRVKIKNVTLKQNIYANLAREFKGVRQRKGSTISSL